MMLLGLRYFLTAILNARLVSIPISSSQESNVIEKLQKNR